MEQKGHIAKVDKPTDWVSSAVYVKKRNGQLRVCLDPRELNKHIKIPKLCLPTIDDVTSRLAKAQVFTVLDAKDGILHVKLDENSSKLTTFHTPFGRCKWLRMPFGLCSPPEEFQRRSNCYSWWPVSNWSRKHPWRSLGRPWQKSDCVATEIQWAKLQTEQGQVCLQTTEVEVLWSCLDFWGYFTRPSQSWGHHSDAETTQ